MAADSIEWHEGCLRSWKSTVDSAKAEADSAVARYKKISANYEFYSAQIALAKKEGKEKFDRDRYGFSRLINP